MKLSLTAVLIIVMTSYLCDACFFTNCPNKWNWRKRSDNDVINEKLKQRAAAYPLLKSYLETNQQKVSLYENFLDTFYEIYDLRIFSSFLST